MSWIKEVKEIFDKQNADYACACVGPKEDEPVCPCAMKSVFIKDGRYKQIIDLGEANGKP